MPNVQRLAITKIGTIEERPDGMLDANDWEFATPLLPGGEVLPMEPSAGVLGGWTAVDLHLISHGAPCDCPIGRSHSEQGWI